MKGSKFYLNRYAIAIYDMDDYLVYVADNPRELALRFNLKLQCLQCSLSRHKKFINILGKRQKLYLIDMKEEDE